MPTAHAFNESGRRAADGIRNDPSGKDATMTKHMLVASVNMWSAAPAPILAMLLALQGGYYPAAMGIAGIALSLIHI